VVLEVQELRLVAEHPRLGDDVQVGVVEPDVTHRQDVHADVAQEVPDEATARTQDPPELAVLEQQAALVLTHLDTTQNEPHGNLLSHR
jgi:hypothetical protein